LPVGSDKIGKYFSLKDIKIAQNLAMHNYLIINEPLMRVMDLSREMDGVAWILNAYNRSNADQLRLQNDPRYEAAKYSPHEVNMATDINCAKFDKVVRNGKTELVLNAEASRKEVYRKVGIIQTAAKKLGIKVRIGYKQYLSQAIPMYFVHIDVCPEYYPAGKPFHNHKHPVQWESEITW
jgi:hypothetical protein